METKTIIFGILTLTALFTGGAVAYKFKKYINYFIAFCGGTLVATSLIEILPEAIEHVGLIKLDLTLQIVLISFLAFMLLDKIFLIHNHAHEEDMHDEKSHDHQHADDVQVDRLHEHSIKHHQIAEQSKINSSPINLISSFGILFHTFLDGLLIGSSFLIGDVSFLLIGGVILLHDFTDGVSTATLLLRNKQDSGAIRLLLLGAGTATVLGIIVSQLLKPSEEMLGYLLATFTGLFLYLGATDLIPDVHKDRSSYKLILTTVLGILTVLIIHIILPAH